MSFRGSGFGVINFFAIFAGLLLNAFCGQLVSGRPEAFIASNSLRLGSNLRSGTIVTLDSRALANEAPRRGLELPRRKDNPVRYQLTPPEEIESALLSEPAS